MLELQESQRKFFDQRENPSPFMRGAVLAVQDKEAEIQKRLSQIKSEEGRLNKDFVDRFGGTVAEGKGFRDTGPKFTMKDFLPKGARDALDAQLEKLGRDWEGVIGKQIGGAMQKGLVDGVGGGLVQFNKKLGEFKKDAGNLADKVQADAAADWWRNRQNARALMDRNRTPDEKKMGEMKEILEAGKLLNLGPEEIEAQIKRFQDSWKDPASKLEKDKDLKATESRFLTRGSGNLNPAEKAQLEIKNDVRKQTEFQQKMLQLWERMEKKDPNILQVETVA
jgi:hypothetical protein